MVSFPTSVTVTTTVSVAVPFSQARSSVTMLNYGTETIFIGTTSELATGNGFPVLAGQALVFARDFGDDPTLARYALANAGSQDMRVMEEYGTGLSEAVLKLVEAVQKR